MPEDVHPLSQHPNAAHPKHPAYPTHARHICRQELRQRRAKAGAYDIMDSIEELEQKHRMGGTIPLERCLVPLSAYAPRDPRA